MKDEKPKDEERRGKGTTDPQQTDSGEGVSRRTAIKAGVAGVAAALTGGGAVFVSDPAEATGGGGRDSDDDSEGLVLVNGKIHTMDDRNRVVSSVAIKNGRFVEVGRAGGGGKVINLGGRTVVPGLIESHTHFVSLANRPGYHVAQLELASNIREVQEMLAARRPDVPPNQFITAMGGWNPIQWGDPPRLPTLAELDAAVPDRPVLLYQRFNGPCATNTRGKQFFEAVVSPLAGPVVVSPEGLIASGLPSTTALYHLRVRQTFEDKKRSTFDAMAFSAEVGVTTNLDQTLVALASGPRDPQPEHLLPNLDHFRMYDSWLALHREGKTFVRLQMNFLHNQGNLQDLGGLENQLPELRERLKNQFQFFGDDMLRTGAIGEWAAPFVSSTSTNVPGYQVWFEAQRLCAQARWRNENSQASEAGIQQVVETYELMDKEFGIQELRWGLQHADQATAEQIERLKNLNCGVSMSGFRWQNNPSATGAPVGPFFPRIVESGIKAALHEDGVHIAPHNPWFALHYATTGLNFNGLQINPDQQITRQQALHAYTRAAAWYLNRENDLGSIEVGKLADLVVLDKDYFKVSDSEMRNIRPLLTIVDGKVVHDAREPRGRGKGKHGHHHDHDRRRG